MNDKPSIDAIFCAAIEIESSDEREAYLSQAGGEDAELRRQVERLLRAHFRGGSIVDSPAHAMGATIDLPPVEQPGMRIGPYRLLQELGEGGMGSVFLAEQQHPMERRVALKIIKAGMDSRQVLARFEAEEQALALMDHPNIAKVHDAGTTESGRPYFVMELVRGISITQYCDQENLTPRERLELFIPVCQAVQHAHQKGIIHRDLKPSNVIVALYDGQPVPKVIDFGVAKATGAKLTERTIFTEVGQMVGTLEYMAPEQAELNNLDIDTRADIYSLGVLLYELLTGSPPFSTRALRGAAFGEMLRMIREVEPPKPSTRLSHSDQLPTIAAHRKLEPQRLTRLVSGELDWIVMKCLEKERARRYDAATGLIADIEHYLCDEPVQAGPPSRLYRFRKLVRRNKAMIIAAAVVAAALLVGLCGTSWQAIRAKRAESRAEAETERARTEAAIASAVRGFLQHDLLQQADMQTQADSLLQSGRRAAEATPNPTIRELLDRATQKLAPDKIDVIFPQQYLVQAEILETIGDTYRGLGAYELAVGLLQRAADLRKKHPSEDDPNALDTLLSLAVAYGDAGRMPEAIQLLEQIAAARTTSLGPDHQDTLVTLNILALHYWRAGKLQQSFQLWQQVRAAQERTLGPDHLATLTTLHNLALAYGDAGNHPEAIRLLEQVLKAHEIEFGPDHPNTMTALFNLGVTYSDAGDLPKAVQLLEQVHTAQKNTLDPDHPKILATLNALAVAYGMTGRLPEAIQLLEQVRTVMEAKYGPNHPDTLLALHDLGVAYGEVGRLPEAIQLLEQVRAVQEEKLGRDHLDTLTTVHNLALTCQAAERLPEAIQLLEQNRAIVEAKFDANHPQMVCTLDALASVYWEMGRRTEASRLWQQVQATYESKFGRQHPQTARAVAKLGVSYLDTGRLAEAVPLLEEAFRASQQEPSLSCFGADLLEAYVKAEKSAEATALAKELLVVLRQSVPQDSPELAGNLGGLGLALLHVNAFADAEAMLRECLTIRETIQPDDWTTFDTKSMLGGALVGQAKELQANDAAAATAKFIEAEPLLVQGYEGVQQRTDKIPLEGRVRPTEALQRLVDLYTNWGKPTEAAVWQQKLDNVTATESSTENKQQE